MADGADLQKVLQQKKEERHRLEQERQWLMQRDSKERKLTSAMALATKRAKRVIWFMKPSSVCLRCAFCRTCL